MNTNPAAFFRYGLVARALCATSLSVAMFPSAMAQVTNISDIPLTTVAATVKPNLMFILDDSGSMGRNYMPDEVSDLNANTYGFYASQCNGLAYKPPSGPVSNYPLPVDAAGAQRAAGTFTFPQASSLSTVRTVSSAPPSITTGSVTVTVSSTGYSTGNVVTLYSNDNQNLRMVGTVTGLTASTLTINVPASGTQGTGTLTNPRVAIGDNRPFYFNYSGSSTALGWTYNASGLITSTNFYIECNTAIGIAPSTGATFTRVYVSPFDSATSLQDYRNWNTYYRTRLLMAQSATSLAFRPITDRFRVGFTTISSTRVSGTDFLDVADFDTTTQKPAFYTSLNNATAGNSTPLRGALSKAGKYFAKMGTRANGTAQTYDPVQYSCQKNFAILTTDGYWNTGDEVSGSGADSYGPDRLDNTDVGQQDGTPTPTPMLDSAVSVSQERSSTLQQRTVTPQFTTGTSTLRQRSVTPQFTTGTSSLQQRSVSGSLTISTSNLQQRTTALFEETSNDFGATWVANATPVSSCQWDTNGRSRRRCFYGATGSWSNVGSCTARALDSNSSDGTTWYPGVTCQYTAWTAPVVAGSCTPQAQDLTSPHTVGVATQCTFPTYGAWTNTSTCTTSATNECRYAPPVNTTTTSCTAVAQSAGPNYTVATAVQCTALTPLYGAWSNVPSCTTSPTNECGYSAPVNTTTTSCTAVPQSPGPTYTVATAVQCTTRTPLYSAWTNASSCTASATNECQYTNWTAWTNIVTSCTAAAQSTAPNYTVGTARECQSLDTGGSSNSLADVAMYYYNTDLRTSTLGNCTGSLGSDVCSNSVLGSGLDTATHQHMTTFTVGMGVSGTLRYTSDYMTGGSPDFQAIRQGTLDWPNPSGSAGAVNIDDLWHAAVNGRGQYFSALNPAALASSLRDALLAIDEITGSGSGAAATTLQPVAGDNSLFIAKYTTVEWTGDLVSREINPETGVISSTDTWTAASRLEARINAGTARNIYYMQRTAGTNRGTLRPFTHANLTSDGLAGNFNSVCSKTVPLTQCSNAGYDVAGANDGVNVVEWLRGTHDNARFRRRELRLGDIVGGAPVFVRRPSFQYTENGYATFASSNASRTGVVYVAANDGMLHAFRGETTDSIANNGIRDDANPGPGGDELWAYVPTMVMDRMYRLADFDYPNRHLFLTNGAPVIGDIYVPPVAPATVGTWKTILVAGLGAGGRGYYALDITDPHNPRALWEFTNDSLGGNNNLGLTFGNPVITKRANGTWVVAFTSGYNNVSPGDGNGRLFVVDANTGVRVTSLATETSAGVAAGTTTTPSGLGKLNAWVDSVIDNTARRFYAGDLRGNLWRFDIDNLVAPNNAAHRLAYLRAGSPAAAQPISTQPALAEVNYAGTRYPVVYVATGKVLGDTDLGDPAVQSVYAIKDPLDATSVGDAHASTSMVAQTLSQASVNAPRTATTNAVDWSTRNGWYVDLIGVGERVNVDPQVVFQNLMVASNIPNTGACEGSSYLYSFNINSGSAPQGVTNVGTWLGTSLVVGMSYLTLQAPGGQAGSGRTITVIVDNRGVPRTDDVPPPPPPPASGRRASWRELVN